MDSNTTTVNSSRFRTILAVDSSTQLASVALQVEGQSAFAEECFRQKSHSEWINGALEKAIAFLPRRWNEVDLLVVAHGPGSFTGVRVATNLVKTIAYAQNKPIASYSSLEVLANQAVSIPETNLVLPVINAFKNMVFTGLYRSRVEGKAEVLLEPRVVELSRLQDMVREQLGPLNATKVQLLGDGLAAYPSFFSGAGSDLWLRTPTSKDHPLATTLVKLVELELEPLKLKSWRELVPTYLRASAAEENKNETK